MNGLWRPWTSSHNDAHSLPVMFAVLPANVNARKVLNKKPNGS